MEVVWYLSSFCVFAVIWSYHLTIVRAEGGYRLVRAAGVQRCPYQ